jgi:hypothetical protein
MLTAWVLHGEQTGVEWTARPLRPVARWTAQRDENGRPRLQMTWSVPEVTPDAATATATTDWARSTE